MENHPISLGKLTISMAMINSYVSHYQWVHFVLVMLSVSTSQLCILCSPMTPGYRQDVCEKRPGGQVKRRFCVWTTIEQVKIPHNCECWIFHDFPLPCLIAKRYMLFFSPTTSEKSTHKAQCSYMFCFFQTGSKTYLGHSHV